MTLGCRPTGGGAGGGAREAAGMGVCGSRTGAGCGCRSAMSSGDGVGLYTLSGDCTVVWDCAPSVVTLGAGRAGNDLVVAAAGFLTRFASRCSGHGTDWRGCRGLWLPTGGNAEEHDRGGWDPTKGPTSGGSVTEGQPCPTVPPLVSLQGCSHLLGCHLCARWCLCLWAERCPGCAGAAALRGHGPPPLYPKLCPSPYPQAPLPRTQLHHQIPSRFYLASLFLLYSS